MWMRRGLYRDRCGPSQSAVLDVEPGHSAVTLYLHPLVPAYPYKTNDNMRVSLNAEEWIALRDQVDSLFSTKNTLGNFPKKEV